jgi:hypothetical protein
MAVRRRTAGVASGGGGVFVPGNYYTKTEVDALLQNYDWKDAAETVTVANIANLASSGTNTFNGVTLSNGQRLLVNAQTDQTTNGIYVYNLVGPNHVLTRATDFDVPSEMTQGVAINVKAGDDGVDPEGSTYIMSVADVVTVGVDPIKFSTIENISIVGGTRLTFFYNDINDMIGEQVTIGGRVYEWTDSLPGAPVNSITYIAIPGSAGKGGDDPDTMAEGLRIALLAENGLSEADKYIVGSGFTTIPELAKHKDVYAVSTTNEAIAHEKAALYIIGKAGTVVSTGSSIMSFSYDTFTLRALAERHPIANVVTVGKEGLGTDFSFIDDAIQNSLATDLILVYPGVYEEILAINDYRRIHFLPGAILQNNEASAGSRLMYIQETCDITGDLEIVWDPTTVTLAIVMPIEIAVASGDVNITIKKMTINSDNMNIMHISGGCNVNFEAKQKCVCGNGTAFGTYAFLNSTSGDVSIKIPELEYTGNDSGWKLFRGMSGTTLLDFDFISPNVSDANDVTDFMSVDNAAQTVTYKGKLRHEAGIISTGGVSGVTLNLIEADVIIGGGCEILTGGSIYAKDSDIETVSTTAGYAPIYQQGGGAIHVEDCELTSNNNNQGECILLDTDGDEITIVGNIFRPDGEYAISSSVAITIFEDRNSVIGNNALAVSNDVNITNTAVILGATQTKPTEWQWLDNNTLVSPEMDALATVTETLTEGDPSWPTGYGLFIRNIDIVPTQITGAPGQAPEIAIEAGGNPLITQYTPVLADFNVANEKGDSHSLLLQSGSLPSALEISTTTIGTVATVYKYRAIFNAKLIKDI